MQDIAFERDFDPRYGEAVTLMPGLRRIVCRNPSPFTFRGTSSYLLGTDDLALIDPGPRDDAHFAALERAIGPARLSAIVVTHGHADHVGGLEAIRAATGAPVFAVAEAVRPRILPPPGAVDAARPVSLMVDFPLADGATVEGTDWRLETVLTPGHAFDHACFALAGTDILFSGDHVMGWSTTVVAPPDGHMASYMASLRRLAARPERLYLPGHGAPIENGQAYARALLAHRRNREAAILRGLRGGETSVEGLVATLYRGLDGRLVHAAAFSVLAHLEHLTERGLARAESGAGLTAVYRAA